MDLQSPVVIDGSHLVLVLLATFVCIAHLRYSRWAGVLAGGISVQALVLACSMVGTWLHWGFTRYGRPLGLLAAVFPFGIFIGELGLVIGIVGIFSELRAARADSRTGAAGRCSADRGEGLNG
jgi:hypothetical protein